MIEASGFTDHFAENTEDKKKTISKMQSARARLENYRSQDSGSSTDLKAKNGMK